MSPSGSSFTDKEVRFLEEAYQKGSKVARLEAKSIAEKMGCEEKRVKSWICRRRKKDESVPAQNRFTDEEKEQLEIAFQQKGSIPEMQVYKEIAEMMNIKNVKRIIGWFSHRRKSKLVPPTFSREQEKFLMSIYETCKYPHRERRNHIAKKLGATMDEIHAWFLAERIKNKNIRVVSQRKRSSLKTPQGIPDLNATTTKLLEAAFAENPLPTSEKLKEIQEKTDIGEHRLTTWFERKRRSIKNPTVNSRSMRYMTPWKIVLEEEYQKNKILTANEVNELEGRLGVERWRIVRWFRQRRYKDRDFDKDDSLLLNCRTRIGADKMCVLNKAYQNIENFTPEEAYALADRVGLTQRQVQSWYRKKKCADTGCTRARFTTDQNQLLQAAYQKNPRPSRKEEEELATKVRHSLRQVKIWYEMARSEAGIAQTKARLTIKQKGILQDAFNKDQHPPLKKVQNLMVSAGLTEAQVRNWNQRARNKARKLGAANILQEKQEEPDLRDMDVEIKMEPVDEK